MCKLKDSLIKRDEKKGTPLSLDKQEECVDVLLEDIYQDKIKENTWDIEASDEELEEYLNNM